MPIDGMPDSAVHKVCIRCRKWFEQSEGIVTIPPRPGLKKSPIEALVVGLRHAIVPRPAETFICNRCRRARRIISIAVWLSFAVVAGCALLLHYCRVVE